MNEVTRIHLGRQPFTISVAAHRALKAYLAEIAKQVGDKDVVNEVELRMAELLGERGISGEKVILDEDVDFLKQQLGHPSDFSDDQDEQASETTDSGASRRLYRDVDQGLVAGVAAGIAGYFGLDAALVRIIFVLLTIFSGGLGLVLYAILWLVVPPATTASEKLQMQGKSVTLESLKDSVNKAGLSSSAQRVSSSAVAVVNRIFIIAVKLLGIGFVLGGAAILFAVAAIKTYMILHHGQLFQENLFPVGAREQWLVVIVMALVALMAVFLVLIGIASFKHKWPIRSWVTAVLVGVFLVALVPAFALTADVAPRVRDRYETTLHSTAVSNIQPFNSVTTTGDIDITYIPSPSYAVDLHYSGKPDLSKIKVSVKDNVLYVDSTTFDNSKNCTMLCLFPRYNMTVEIFAPNVSSFTTPPRTEKFFPPTPAALYQPPTP